MPGRDGELPAEEDHPAGHDKVWFARRIDVARHWIASHPFAE
jgi:hypothetical protein